MCMLYTQVFAQFDTLDLPRPYYYMDKVVGVIISLEQAQKIDNDYEVFTQMEKLIKEYNLSDSITISIVNVQNEKIALLEAKIDNNKHIITEKDSLITNLNKTIDTYIRDIMLYKELDTVNKNEIKTLKDENRKNRRQKIAAFVTSGILAVAIIVVSIVK